MNEYQGVRDPSNDVDFGDEAIAGVAGCEGSESEDFDGV